MEPALSQRLVFAEYTPPPRYVPRYVCTLHHSSFLIEIKTALSSFLVWWISFVITVETCYKKAMHIFKSRGIL